MTERLLSKRVNLKFHQRHHQSSYRHVQPYSSHNSCTQQPLRGSSAYAGCTVFLLNNLDSFCKLGVLLLIPTIRVMNMAKSATRLFPVYRTRISCTCLSYALHNHTLPLGYCLHHYKLQVWVRPGGLPCWRVV